MSNSSSHTPDSISIESLANPQLPYELVSNNFKHYGKRTAPDPLLDTDCQIAREQISQWPGYETTPLLDLGSCAEGIGLASVYYKDEAPRFGLGSFKALGGAYAVSRILLQKLDKEIGDELDRELTLKDLTSGEFAHITQNHTVSCATDGNHGRSVAWGAQRFHCQCVIYIHSEVSEGRREAIERYGAKVLRIEGNYDDSVRIAANEADRLGRTVVSDTSYPGYLEIPADVMRGYTVLADEAVEQLNTVQPTHVFLQGGVGGFAAAITARIRKHYPQNPPRIVIVEPDQAACIYQSIKRGEPVVVSGELDTIMAGLACGEVSLIAFDILLHDCDDVLIISDHAAILGMQLLAKGALYKTPVVSGESGVTGLAGLIQACGSTELKQALQLDEDSRVLVFGTEGATDPDVYRELVGQTAESVVLSITQ